MEATRARRREFRRRCGRRGISAGSKTMSSTPLNSRSRQNPASGDHHIGRNHTPGRLRALSRSANRVASRPSAPAKKNGFVHPLPLLIAHAIEQTGAGIDERRLPVRNVRRRLHPLQSRVRPDHAVMPLAHAHDFQARADAETVVEEHGQFADGHTVAHRDRIEADKRSVTRFEHRPFDRAADRDWADRRPRTPY